MPAETFEFLGFDEPKTNYTRLPNEYFDSRLRILTSAENCALLIIFRLTWGWQKLFDQISESQMIKRTCLSKNTVRKALNGLEKQNCILRFATGNGRNRKTYFFICTPKTRQIVHALKSGRITIEQALIFNSITGDIGSIADPINGSKIDPIARQYHHRNGSNTDPTKESRTKKLKEKKAAAPTNARPSPSNSKPTNTAEQIREQRLTTKRQQAGSSVTLMRLGDVLANLTIPVPETSSL